MKRTIIVNMIAVVILAVAAAIAYGYITTKPETRKTAKKSALLSVKAYNEKISNFPLFITYPARVTSQEVVTLGVEVGGKIERGAVALKKGENFKKGELLFYINSEQISTELMSAKSDLLTAMSQVLPDIKFDFKDEYNKWLTFFNKINLTDKLPQLPKLNSSKERVYMATNGVLSKYYDIVSQEIDLSRHTIYAPFDGVFTEVSKEVGAILSQNEEVGTISSTDHLEVIVAVSLTNIARINDGDSATVKSRNGESFKGVVKRIATYVDQQTQMVDVYIHIFDPERKIISGEMVDVELSAGVLKDVVKLPIEALANDDKIYYIDKDKKMYSLPVKVEYELGEWAYIKGIEDNTLIVQESIITPVEGTLVNVINNHIN